MTAPIDTERLNAWLDDELPPEERAEVEAWLRDNPEDAARVRLWAADAQALRARLEPVLAEPVPQRLEQIVWSRGPATVNAGWQRWAAAALVFVLGGAVGAVLTWRVDATQFKQRSAAAATQGWVERAKVAHVVYTPEVRHPVEVPASGQEDHLAGWLTKRLDVPVKMYDLRAQGFELVGGRLLPDAKGPSAQLMYQEIIPPGEASAAGVKPLRVTVYLRKPDDETPAAFRYEQQGSLGMFYWVEGRSERGGACGYALVGELPRERLLVLAEAIFRQGE